MPINKKLKWRRCLSSLKFLHEELDYIKAVSRDAAPEFEAFYRKFCAEKNVNINELDRQHKQKLDKLYGRNVIADNETQDEPEIDNVSDTAIAVHNKKIPQDDKEYQMTADEMVIHEAFTKLFKKIALKIHPDKIDKTLSTEETKSRVSMFQDSLKALEDKKYFILLDVAEQFNITTPKNYEPQIRWMKAEAERLHKAIHTEKNTYNYCFAEAETDEEKQVLIRKFLHQLFRMSVQ